MEKCSKNRGFTLAELLIVVAIIGILVAISIPIFTAQLEKAREATDLSNIRSAYTAAVADAITTKEPIVDVNTGIAMKSQGAIEMISSEKCGPWNTDDIVINNTGKVVTVHGELNSDGKWTFSISGGATAPAVVLGS